MIEQVGNLIFVNGIFEKYTGITENGKPVLRTIRLDRVDTPYGRALVLAHDEYYKGDTPTIVSGFDAGHGERYMRAGYSERVTRIKTTPVGTEQQMDVAKILKEGGYRAPISFVADSGYYRIVI